MWVHYVLNCGKCGELGLGFDGSPLVYYNAGRLAKGNFTPCHPLTLDRADAAHTCHCGNKVTAQRILFDDYKILNSGDKSHYEAAIDNYKCEELRAEIWKLTESNSDEAISIEKDKIVARARGLIGYIKSALSEGAEMEVRNGQFYIRPAGYQRFKKVEI